MYLARTPYLLKKIYPKAVWRFSPSEKNIYLTFDDGPIDTITTWVLDELKKYNVKATFFCVGANIEKQPEIYKRIIEEGHQTGNHTYNHLNGWNTHTRTYLKNVLMCEDTLNKNVSQNTSSLTLKEKKLFRPPYGKVKNTQYSILNTQYSIIMWDVLSGDYDKKTTNEKCLSNVIDNVRNGSIVLFHDSIKAEANLKYALPQFIEWALKEGYSFKRVEV